MAGELSFLIILEEEVDVEVVRDALVVLIWSVMSVVSLVILLENAAHVVVLEDVAAAALDIVGAQAMVAEATVLVDGPQDAAVSLRVGVTTASLPNTAVARKCHMLMEMV